MEYRTATPADEPSLHALWHTAFGAAPVAELWHADRGRHRRTFIADDGTRAVSAVHYLPRPIRSATGAVETVGCIGSVATLPESRGRGHIRTLLAAALRTMTDDGCTWSLLFTGTPHVYESAGYRSFDIPTWHGPVTHATWPVSSPEVRPARPADHAALAALHERYNARRPLSTPRTAGDWHHRVALRYDARSTETLVAENPAGTPIGYVVLRHDGPEAHVLEIALAQQPAATAQSLLGAAAQRARHFGHRTARVRLPAEPAVVAALPALLDPSAVSPDSSGMARAVLADSADVRATVTAPLAMHWAGDAF